MKLTFKSVALGLALCGLASCVNEAPWGDGSRGKGGVDLKLTADASVEDARPTVRAGAPQLVAPDAAFFSIEMRNLDTDYVQTFRTLEEFNNQESFEVGAYTLTAYYGNLDECGFEKPYFKGEATVNVLEGRETSVDVTAQLANSMLSVEYTDEFMSYFRDYSVTAHTDGHANVTFGKYESRAGFLTPGTVALQVSVTNPSGKTASFTPAGLKAVARHHYHVKFDVNADPVGDVTLTISFDDSTTKEDVKFTLSDELYNADAPVVSAEGFTNGEMVEVLSGNPAVSPLKFETICKSGIKSAVLKIAQVNGTQTFTPSFGNELDLMTADESVQNALERTGIKVAGIFKNPDQMAIVDVTELPKYLPTGTFEVTFTVTDNLDRANETPVVLNLSTQPINLEVTGGSAAYVCTDLSSTGPTAGATVWVTYNGLHPETAISFKNICSRQSTPKDCEIVEVVESTGTRSFPDKNYIFNIKVCDVETSPLPMEIWFNGSKYAEFTLDIIEPKFTLEADAFATYALFKVVPEDPQDLATIVNGLTLYKNGVAQAGSVSRNPEKGMLTMEGLQPDTDYTIGYALTTRAEGVPESQHLNIHTESAPVLPNGDFSSLRATISHNDLPIGGQYTFKVGITYTYTNVANVRVKEPEGWASINKKTFYSGAKNKNSWYTVVSTYADENGGVTMRSVAYDHNGATLAKTETELTKNHYCKSVPSDFAFRSAGELFLGEFSYDGNDNRSEGVGFTSRPSSLSFDYSYSPVGSDRGEVAIILLDENKEVIGSKSSYIDAGESSKTVIIENYVFGSKAKYLKVQFKSSAYEAETVTPDPSVDSWDGTLPATPYLHRFEDNAFRTFASGSKLTIRNVKLNY